MPAAIARFTEVPYVAASQSDTRQREGILNIHPISTSKDAKPSGQETVSGAQDVLARLRADIVRNTFEPHAKLKFAELTRRYGLGIGTLREALSQLVSEGLVTLEAGKGFRVAPVSRADLL